MPHAHSSSAASSGGDDLGSTDEVKVFKDEGDGEDEKRSSELLEEKSSLIDWTESEEKSGEPYSGKLSVKSDLSPVFGKLEPHAAAGFNMGYLMAPYPYPNGGAHPLPVSMAGKMGIPAGGGLSLFCPPGDLGQPPPAHMGIPPPYQLDSKLAAGLARTPMYPFPGGTYPYPMLSPEMSQVAASWHTPSMYPITSVASGFRSPYPTSLPITSSSLTSELYRFSPTLGGSLGLGLGPALVPPPPSKADLDSHQRYARSLEKNSGSGSSDKQTEGSANNNSKEQNKKPHIKKPLNAFMLYMKEMRAKVVAECTLKESAAINQILGRRWHSLSREEQAKYYEKARQERQLHMQLYPGWSARDNYGYGSKKKKRKKDRSPAELGGNNLKKCRARYGLDQQNQWCKPCRRKKKCVRYMEALAAASGTVPLPMATPQSPCSDGEDVKLEELSDASSDADTPLNSASSPGELILVWDKRGHEDFKNFQEYFASWTVENEKLFGENCPKTDIEENKFELQKSLEAHDDERNIRLEHFQKLAIGRKIVLGKSSTAVSTIYSHKKGTDPEEVDAEDIKEERSSCSPETVPHPQELDVEEIKEERSNCSPEPATDPQGLYSKDIAEESSSPFPIEFTDPEDSDVEVIKENSFSHIPKLVTETEGLESENIKGDCCSPSPKPKLIIEIDPTPVPSSQHYITLTIDQIDKLLKERLRQENECNNVEEEDDIIIIGDQDHNNSNDENS